MEGVQRVPRDSKGAHEGNAESEEVSEAGSEGVPEGCLRWGLERVSNRRARKKKVQKSWKTPSRPTAKPSKTPSNTTFGTPSDTASDVTLFESALICIGHVIQDSFTCVHFRPSKYAPLAEARSLHLGSPARSLHLGSPARRSASLFSSSMCVSSITGTMVAIITTFLIQKGQTCNCNQ